MGLVCGLASCGDFLEIEPRNLVILEQFWNEKTDVENTVAGCYEGMQSSAVITRLMAWGEFRSDNITVGEKAESDDLHMYKFLQANIDPSNVYTDWSSLYTVINRCNTVILYAPDVQKKDPSFNESDLRGIIAEVSALRDLCYFYLIRTFRNVPYTTTAYTDDSQKMDIAAQPFEAVLDSLINDLEHVKGDAVSRYPTDADKKLYQTGRITREAIYAMLCEMYLWKGDYQQCINYAELIKARKVKDAEEDMGTLYADMSKYFNGWPLIRDWTSQTGIYGNAYEEIFGEGNSVESIFELTYMKNDNMLANGAVNTYYGYLDGSWYRRVAPSQYLTNDISNTLFKVFKNKYDARNYESMFSAGGISKYVAYYKPVEVSTSNSNVLANTSSVYAKDKNHSNWIIYRLTDIMLMEAEAKVQLAADNDDPLLEEAFELVQTVYRRSVLKDPDKITDSDLLKFPSEDAKTEMEKLVMEERQRELLFEGKRWFDLVRRSMRDGNNEYLSQQVANKGLQNAAIVASNLESTFETIFLPAYLEEWKVNSNVWKNPAYTYEEKD